MNICEFMVLSTTYDGIDAALDDAIVMRRRGWLLDCVAEWHSKQSIVVVELLKWYTSDKQTSGWNNLSTYLASLCHPKGLWDGNTICIMCILHSEKLEAGGCYDFPLSRLFPQQPLTPISIFSSFLMTPIFYFFSSYDNVLASFLHH